MGEWNAAEYAQGSGLQAAMAAEVLATVVLAGDERVLDIGCGDGKITAAIAQRVPRGSVTGVDPSREMIAFASAHFGPPAAANLTFDVADARELPFVEAFDRVVSFNALHWIPDQDIALRTIPRADLQVYEGSGHAVHWAQPARFAQDVCTFVRERLEPRCLR